MNVDDCDFVHELHGTLNLFLFNPTRSITLNFKYIFLIVDFCRRLADSESARVNRISLLFDVDIMYL